MPSSSCFDAGFSLLQVHACRFSLWVGKPHDEKQQWKGQYETNSGAFVRQHELVYVVGVLWQNVQHCVYDRLLHWLHRMGNTGEEYLRNAIYSMKKATKTQNVKDIPICLMHSIAPFFYFGSNLYFFFPCCIIAI